MCLLSSYPEPTHMSCVETRSSRYMFSIWCYVWYICLLSQMLFRVCFRSFWAIQGGYVSVSNNCIRIWLSFSGDNRTRHVSRFQSADCVDMSGIRSLLSSYVSPSFRNNPRTCLLFPGNDPWHALPIFHFLIGHMCHVERYSPASCVSVNLDLCADMSWTET